MIYRIIQYLNNKNILFDNIKTNKNKIYLKK